MRNNQLRNYFFMKVAGLLAAGFVLLGCQKNFMVFLDKARKDFSERNYINTVDGLNVGLLHWQETDGDELKAEAYQLLGQSYHRLRNTDKAIEAFNDAIRLSTNTFPSAYALGMLLLTKNQIEPALHAFQSALKMKPDDPMSLLGLANCYFSLRRYKDAQFTYQKIIDASPGVREAIESLALVKNKLREKPTVLKNRAANSVYRAPAKKPDPNVSFKKTGKKK